MEKVMVASSRNLEGTNTVICGTRYGNVMASRGSVIPLFVEQVLAGKPITVMGDYFRIPPDARDLNYAKFVEVGEQRNTASSHGEDYNSHNTTRLDVAGMKALLLNLDFMQRIARGEHAVAEE